MPIYNEVLGQKLYTLAEVATLFGVSRSSIQHYKKDRGLKAITIGGKIYVSEEAIKAFIKEDLTQPEYDNETTEQEVEEPQLQTKKRTYLAI